MAAYPTHNPPSSSQKYRNKGGWGGFTASDWKVAGAGANLLGSFVQAEADVGLAGYKKFTSEQQARLLLRNAEERFASGTREAKEYVRQGRKTESDAITAMIAQGGTVDPTILAKLKQQSTYDAMSAIFDATRASEGMKLESLAIENAAKINYDYAKVGAANSKFGAALNFGTSLMAAYT